MRARTYNSRWMPNRTEIRALVLDYGEVLCHPADPAGLAGMARLAGTEPDRFTDAYWEHREGYDRGALEVGEYWRLVGESVGVTIDDRLESHLIARDITLWTRLDDAMIAWANGIAASGVRVGLLSNMVREIGIHLRDELALFRSFTSVTYSYELLLAKPDPEIYRHALDRLGASPDEALFVDDRIRNIEAARALGLHAHHFRRRSELLAEIETKYELVAAS